MADSPAGFHVLSDDMLSDLGITTAEIVAAIESALRSQREGDTLTAPKSALVYGDGRYYMTTLSLSDAPPFTVVKSVMVSPRNPARGFNSTEGAVFLQDSETGHLLAVMQAGWITGVRTAGLSAVAARRLANPEAKTIAFVGTGQQARSHLATFADLFPLAGARIYGRGKPNIERLRGLCEQRGVTPTVCTSPRDALTEADIVVSSVTLSFELTPFLDARWLKPGAFAAITDAAVPWMPDGMGAFGRIYIDDLVQERESAKKMVDPAQITGELPALLDPEPAGFDPNARSAFVFRGMAIGDFAVASLAHERARAAGVGNWAGW